VLVVALVVIVLVVIVLVIVFSGSPVMAVTGGRRRHGSLS
jgi:hypothetical protein